MLINQKAGFFIFDIDSIEYAKLFNKPEAQLNDNYRMLIAKAISNDTQYSKFLDAEV